MKGKRSKLRFREIILKANICVIKAFLLKLFNTPLCIVCRMWSLSEYTWWNKFYGKPVFFGFWMMILFNWKPGFKNKWCHQKRYQNISVANNNVRASWSCPCVQYQEYLNNWPLAYITHFLFKSPEAGWRYNLITLYLASKRILTSILN